MKSEAKRKRTIRIHITTYKAIFCQGCKMDEKSCKKCMCNKPHSKYVCSICLNQKTEGSNESCKRITKNCPICQKNKEGSGKMKERETVGVEKETFRTWANISDTKGKEHSSLTRDRTKDNVHERLEAEKDLLVRGPNVKTVQTSGTNVAQGITLLNEVLTVFQNKKVDINKEKVKSGLLKDVAVSTVDKEDKSRKDKPRLTVSSFQYSIDEKKTSIENGKFTVVNCTQPIYLRRLRSIDLPKYKSSSIPQMKLEELKYSLKEKSKSKDAIEEVNRMFATVRNSNKTIDENSNRPSVRSGPRVLPLVINNPGHIKNNFNTNQADLHHCKCCQTCMSSGDSFANIGCGQDTHKPKKCEKCYYMLCCHYENAHRKQTGMLFCEHCKDLDDQCCQNDSSG